MGCIMVSGSSFPLRLLMGSRMAGWQSALGRVSNNVSLALEEQTLFHLACSGLIPVLMSLMKAQWQAGQRAWSH